MKWLPLPPLRVILGWAIVIFIIWFVINNPDRADTDARWIGHVLSEAAHGLTVFVNNL
jgi:hypothetical protein